MKIKILYFLGNPGENFKFTYHNIAKDLIESKIKNWKSLKFCAYSSYNHLIVAKNLTFMNLSGLGVEEILKKFKIKPQEFCLVHDDADILFGKIKFQFKKDSAGHKGVESVIKKIKTNEFWRLRIGIQFKKRKKAQEFILEKLIPYHKNLFEKKLKKNFSKILDAFEKPVEKISLPQDILYN